MDKNEEKDMKLFLRALGQFRKTGENSVECDVCESEIVFEDNDRATRHRCKCGKFDGSLRGL